MSSESLINLSTDSLGRVGGGGVGREENPELRSNPFLERKTCPVLPRSLGNKAQGFGPMNFPFLLAGAFGLLLIEAVNLSQPPPATSSLPCSPRPVLRGSWEACAISWLKRHLHLWPQDRGQPGVGPSGTGHGLCQRGPIWQTQLVSSLTLKKKKD